MTGESKTGSGPAFSFLRSIEPFKNLDGALLQQLADQSRIATFPPEQRIFKLGEKSHEVLYLIMQGAVKIVSEDEASPVSILSAKGDFFGITGLLSNEPYSVSAVATEEITCLLIPRPLVEEAIGSSLKLADFFTKSIATRLKGLYRIIGEEHEMPSLPEQPLRRKVSDAAQPDVLTCLPMDTALEAAGKMKLAGTSSLVVTGFNGKPLGIITNRDLVNRVLLAGDPFPRLRAHDVMSAPLITLQPGAFLYKAFLTMFKHNIKHLVITDQHDVLRGILTMQDLIVNRGSVVLSVIERIKKQKSIAEISKLSAEINGVLEALLKERSYASEITAMITELYDRLTQKIIEIIENQLQEEGYGPPPVGYCFINMGSAGRREQFARTDQDNGIIYADPGPDLSEKAGAYFLEMGKRIVDALQKCGFKRCDGKVMADNPDWCKPLSGWKDTINRWPRRLDPSSIRRMTIFFDFRFIYGKSELCSDLKEFTHNLMKKASTALSFLVEDDLKHRVPLNIFKQIVTARFGRYRKNINLKNAVMVHLVDCARAFALQEGIWETSTFERLEKIRERRLINPDEASYIEAAYETLLMLRIRDTVNKLNAGREPDNYVRVDKLSRNDRLLLRESLLVTNRFQSITAHYFHAHNVGGGGVLP